MQAPREKRAMVDQSSENLVGGQQEAESIALFASAYLRLLAQYGPNLRDHRQLREQRKSEESSPLALTSRRIDRSGVLARQKEGGQAKEA